MAHLTTSVVGTSPVQIAQVPAGHVVTIQNVGATAVWVAVNTQAKPTECFLLAGGSPGGTLSTEPPGDVSDQTWYAATASGTTTVAAMVV